MDDVKLPTSLVPHMKYPFEYFNPAQSLAVPHRDEDVNIVCAFPTGAGKTVVAELVIDHALRRGKKAIYTAPLKALSQEKMNDWSNPNHPFSQRRISIVTGDYRLTKERVEELQKADIIVLTSEMLDSRCRNYETEKNSWLMDVGACIIDEVHLLTVEDRGDCLESGLMRFTNFNKDARLVFLSATVQNSDELAKWANSLNGKKTGHLRSSYRPCPLSVNFVPYDDKRYFTMGKEEKQDAAIEIMLANPLDHILFFVHTKAEGRSLVERIRSEGFTVDFHNADLEKASRLALEQKFRKGELQHLVATNTLAWGVNLPARRVVVMGVHRGRQIVEPVDILQEVGRAGRPGYDKAGDAYILLPQSKFQKFKGMLSVEPTVLSQMRKTEVLAFHTVSGIERGDLRTQDDIVEWFSRSLAAFQGNFLQETDLLDLTDTLENIHAIEIKKDLFHCLPTGKAAAWFYQSPFDVADWRNNFQKILRGNPDDIEIAWAVSHVRSILEKGWCPPILEKHKAALQRALDERGLTLCEQAVPIMVGLIDYLKGNKIPSICLAATQPVIFDSERTIETIKAVGNMTKLYTPDDDFWETLALRVRKGVPKEAVALARIPGIGRARAERLFSAGLRTPMDVTTHGEQVKMLLGDKIGPKVVAAALSIVKGEKPKAIEETEEATDTASTWGVGGIIKK